jgi:hypothetical protein
MNNENTPADRRLIHSADPVAELNALRSDQVVARARTAMDAGAPTPIPGPGPRLRVRRPVLAGILAGAAAVAIGAAVALPLLTAPAPAPLALQQVPGGIAAKCMEPQAQTLADNADVMFRADVRAIDGGTVTLDVTDTLAGAPASVLELPQGDGMVSDGGALVFEAGQTYLLAADGGTILSCGYSGVSSPWLEALYADAAALAG